MHFQSNASISITRKGRFQQLQTTRYKAQRMHNTVQPNLIQPRHRMHDNHFPWSLCSRHKMRRHYILTTHLKNTTNHILNYKYKNSHKQLINWSNCVTFGCVNINRSRLLIVLIFTLKRELCDMLRGYQGGSSLYQREWLLQGQLQASSKFSRKNYALANQTLVCRHFADVHMSIISQY